MKFQSIKKVHEGKFICRYDVSYKTVDGKDKIYEMISRDHNLDSFSKLNEKKTDAVVIIMHDEENKKILLNKEFRMPAGTWVYNFPAGLIEDGEDVAQSAARELKEETGLDIVRVDDILADSFSAIGFSNEKNQCVIGVASGHFAPSTSTFEEISAAWYTKEEILNLLKTEYFAGRTQAYCYMWSKSN